MATATAPAALRIGPADHGRRMTLEEFIEYWILDAEQRRMHALVRAGDVWGETVVAEADVYRTSLRPGLEVRPAELLGPAAGV